MTPERLAALEEELLNYANDVFDNRHSEITRLEIRVKLDALNREIDELTDLGGDEPLHTLCFIAYQYYRLLYT